MIEISKNPVAQSPAGSSSTKAKYLHPDYVQPLPTTVDTKTSPLAMLAQTCNNIGREPKPAPVRSTTYSPPHKHNPMKPLLDFAGHERADVKRAEVSPFLVGSPRSSHTGNIQMSPSSDSKLLAPTSFASSNPLFPFLNGSSLPSSLSSVAGSAALPYPSLLGQVSPLNALTQAHLSIEMLRERLNLEAFYAAVALQQKSAAVAAATQPACRDPHCCPSMAVPNLSSPTSPNQCKQCTHHDVNLAPKAPASPDLPFVCNWMAGSAPCGKRYASNDALLQHVQSHMAPPATSESTTPKPATPSPPQRLPLSPLTAATSAAAPTSPSAAVSLSNALQHLAAVAASVGSSPTGLVPDSRRPASLSPAAHRFHPYGGGRAPAPNSVHSSSLPPYFAGLANPLLGGAGANPYAALLQYEKLAGHI